MTPRMQYAIGTLAGLAGGWWFAATISWHDSVPLFGLDWRAQAVAGTVCAIAAVLLLIAALARSPH